MDIRCPALLQGPNRYVRARQYIQYLQQYYNQPIHQFYTIPNAGHDASQIFGSTIGRQILFG